MDETSGSARDLPPKVIVGSGWWCDQSPHQWAIGATATRQVEFFTHWHSQVIRCLAPQRIIVTDSASPVKPDWRRHERVHWIELDRNYGHAADIASGRSATKYSGFTRSVLSGAMHALCCDADWYVYVEQDCLLFGDGLLWKAIEGKASDILIGQPTVGGIGLGGRSAADMMQQSLMIVRRSGLERFIVGLLSARWTDGELSPEEIMCTQFDPLETVSIKYGRSRPINFSDSHFYAQHLSDQDFRTMIKRIADSQ